MNGLCGTLEMPPLIGVEGPIREEEEEEEEEIACSCLQRRYTRHWTKMRSMDIRQMASDSSSQNALRTSSSWDSA